MRCTTPKNPGLLRKPGYQLVEIARQQQALLHFDEARISYLQLGFVAPGELETVGYRLSE